MTEEDQEELDDMNSEDNQILLLENTEDVSR